MYDTNTRQTHLNVSVRNDTDRRRELSDSQSRASIDFSIRSGPSMNYPGFSSSFLVNDLYSHFCINGNQSVDTTIFAMEIGPAVNFPRSFMNPSV